MLRFIPLTSQSGFSRRPSAPTALRNRDSNECFALRGCAEYSGRILVTRMPADTETIKAVSWILGEEDGRSVGEPLPGAMSRARRRQFVREWEEYLIDQGKIRNTLHFYA